MSTPTPEHELPPTQLEADEADVAEQQLEVPAGDDEDYAP